MRRCTLCGGKLDSTKRCTLCGLDNTKNDSMYKYMANRNTCEDMPLTHVHEEPVKAEPKKVVNKSSYAPTYQVNKPAMPKKMPKNTAKQAKPTGCLSKILAFVPVIIALIGIISSIFDNVGIPEPDFSVGYEEMEVLPDEWDEEGYYCDASLGEDTYFVGYDIPAGLYEIEAEAGSEGYLDVYDTDGYMVFSEYLEEGYIYEVALFDDYEMIVWEGLTVRMITNNAQSLLTE